MRRGLKRHRDDRADEERHTEGHLGVGAASSGCDSNPGARGQEQGQKEPGDRAGHRHPAGGGAEGEGVLEVATAEPGEDGEEEQGDGPYGGAGDQLAPRPAVDGDPDAAGEDGDGGQEAGVGGGDASRALIDHRQDTSEGERRGEHGCVLGCGDGDSQDPGDAEQRAPRDVPTASVPRPRMAPRCASSIDRQRSRLLADGGSSSARRP